MFGDFLKMGVEREDRRYEEVADVSRLTALLEDYLDEYNLSSTNALNLGACLHARACTLAQAEHAAGVIPCMSSTS